MLSDERKRQIYDQVRFRDHVGRTKLLFSFHSLFQVGHDRFSQQVREGRPGGAPDRRAHGHAADFTPEELFEMFFSNAMRGGFNANRNANFSTFRFRRNQPGEKRKKSHTIFSILRAHVLLFMSCSLFFTQKMKSMVLRALLHLHRFC